MPKSKQFPKWIWPLILVIIVGGALIWWVINNKAEPNMDELGKDNLYHYRNEDLGFRLDLRRNLFIIRQKDSMLLIIQRLDFSSTSDPAYVYEIVPSYARPIVIRVYSEDAWNQLKTMMKVNRILKRRWLRMVGFM